MQHTKQQANSKDILLQKWDGVIEKKTNRKQAKQNEQNEQTNKPNKPNKPLYLKN